MAVIWGFNLSEMSWSAFGHRKMFDKQWYLRRERVVIYQLAMLICLAAECTATYSLSKYETHQTNIEARSGYIAHVHNNSLVASQYLTIIFCISVAVLFGTDFFFLLFWPARTYPRWYNNARQLLAVGITAGVGAATLMSTIVVFTGAEYITGVSADQAQEYRAFLFRPPKVYRAWAVNVAYVVLLWIGFVFTLLSTMLMLMAIMYDTSIRDVRVQAERLVPDSVILVEFPARDKDYENEIDKVFHFDGDA